MNRAAPAISIAAAQRRFKPYPAYKDSGVEWLGEIPAHWDLKKLSWLTECLDGRRVPLNAEERGRMQGEYPYWGANSIVDYVDKWLFDETLVLLGEDGAPFSDRAKSVAFRVTGKIWVNNHAHVLRPGRLVDATFLAHALNCVDYRAFIDGSTRDKLTQGDMNAISVQCPRVDEQRAIAAFLDRETARIDALVAKKERLIELLQEKRTALITRAVTKGLDPNVPMKDSGVEWLGEIPAHWEVLASRRLIGRIEQGWSPVAEDRLAGPDEWAVIKLSAVSKGRFVGDEHKALPADLAPDRRYEIREGDFLLTRANTPELVGDVCVARGVRRGLMLCDLVYRLSLASEKLAPSYLAYWFLSRAGRYQIEVDARGSSQSMVKVSQGLIRAWTVVLPPADEQHAIAAFLDRETTRLDALVAKVRDAIARLKELRTALISAAVTGKIDVREHAA